MEYKVVPFNANLQQKDSNSTAASQLQNLINQYNDEGYEFVTIGSIDTYVAGESGCLGIGAKPGYNTAIEVVVFKK